MRKQKGFTLIELLVVIAIIGILAAIVLVSLSGTRDRAMDARIQSGMGQLRATAEIYYNDNGYSYEGLAANSTDWTDSLEPDINANAPTGETVTLTDTSERYCASIKLNSGNWYCVDSTGTVIDDLDTDPAASCANETDDNPSCP